MSRRHTLEHLTIREYGFNPVLGFLSVSTFCHSSAAIFAHACFNPVLGFLSVSTGLSAPSKGRAAGFNPVLGFLSVSTTDKQVVVVFHDLFQSRAGFSECLDVPS